jgi:hypothetical protein
VSAVLANESGMGVLMFTWRSASTGNTGRVIWYDGCGSGPMFQWYSAAAAKEVPPVAIATPERFGWRGGKVTPGAVRKFAQAFANHLEAGDDEAGGAVQVQDALIPPDTPALQGTLFT